MKKLLSLLLVITMVFSLSACNKQSQQEINQSNSTDQAQKKENEVKKSYDVTNRKFNNVKITVASRYGGDIPHDKYFNEMVEKFNTLDNGITVELDTIVTEKDYQDKLRTGFANGDTPNVFMESGGSKVKDFVDANALVDMVPYYEASSNWYNAFNPAFFGELQYPETKDSIWGVPYTAYMVTLYYNKDIFNELGIQPPETMDELLAACKMIKDAGYEPFQTGEQENFRFGHFFNELVLKSGGTQLVDDLASRKVSYDSPEMIKLYKIISDMCQKGYFGTDILSKDASQEKSAFVEGKSAMRWDGSWYVSELRSTPEAYERTGVIRFPYIDEKYKEVEQGGGNALFYISSLNKSEEEIAASVVFLQYITSKEYYEERNKVAAALFPVNYQFDSTDNPLLQEVMNVANVASATRTDIQNYDPATHMIDTVRNALQGLALGNTPEECGKEIVDKIAEYGE